MSESIRDLSNEQLLDAIADITTQLDAYEVWKTRREIRPLSFVVTSWSPINVAVRQKQLLAMDAEVTRRMSEGRALQHYRAVLAESGVTV